MRSGTGAGLTVLAAVACATALPGAPRAGGSSGVAPPKATIGATAGAPRRPYAEGPTIRVALAGDPSPEISASGPWRLTDPAGAVLVRGGASDRWRLERRGGPRLRAVNDRGQTSASFDGTVHLRPEAPGAFVRWNGRRFRGELAFVATDSAILVINRVPLEEYLLGVVPLEIGPDRTTRDQAAVEAQAVAARSYTAVRLSPGRPYDLLAAATDQVYGGVEAERAVSTRAVRETAGLVLTFNGRPVSAPYSSTCGGSTAEPMEVWRSRGEPFLRRVSDRLPDGEGFWCDLAPRQRWERTIPSGELDALLERYLRQYASAPNGPLGALRAVRVDERTPSGRVASMTFTTDRGSWQVRGNDIRFVLRAAGGAPLNSTSFTPEPVVGGGGRITSLTLRGTGYGHGVGMCQWGAIGRSRAGQDFRTILGTYYPGTTIAPLAL